MKKTRVLIVGGGFGGVYTAIEFEKRRDPDFEVTMVSEDNFFLFTPMLHEVAASDLDLTHIVNPMRKILRHVNFINCEVQSIDLVNRTIDILHGFWLGDEFLQDPWFGGACYNDEISRSDLRLLEKKSLHSGERNLA
jgi:NADH dehydrogenase FAD-containing subunit